MDGIINCYKPEGMTSFDVVAKIRKLLHIKKVGHSGTLDPAACGVLPVCVGKATKLIEIIMHQEKCYRVEMTLGIVTDTYDKEGSVLYTRDVKASNEEIKNAIMGFRGEIMQIPPMYSALKHNGKRLYELARAGIEVEREPRPVIIYKIDILSMDDKKVIFDVVCSKGTYIRSLCYDIGQKLGCGAMMSNLTRIYSGRFKIENSIHVDMLNEENVLQHLMSIEQVLIDFPAVKLNDKFQKLFINGVNIKDRELIYNIEQNRYRVYNEDNALIGIGERSSDSFKALLLI